MTNHERTVKPRLRRGFTVLLGGLVLVTLWYAVTAGRRLERAHPEIKLGAAPLVGEWRWRIGAATIWPIVLATIAAVLLPRRFEAMRTRSVVLVCSATAAAFAFFLAAADGLQAVIAPVIHPTEYWVGVRTAFPFMKHLDTFAERGLYHTVHIRGHPPGFILLLIAMKAAHLRSPWAAAALSFLGVAVTVTAVSVTIWRTVGVDAARRMAPLLVFTPFAMWQGTSADAFFCGVACSAIACAAVAATTTGWRSRSAAFAGGALAAALLHLTYGGATVLPIGLAVVVLTRTWRWLPGFATGAASVFGLFLWGGYWWLDGLRAVRVHYWEGTAKFRPPVYFAIANMAVLIVAVGLPVVWSLTRLRWSRVTAWPLAALVCVAIAEASQMSKGETERIWLLYMPWLTVAGLAAVRTVPQQRRWMVLQAIAAIGLQSALVSKW